MGETKRIRIVCESLESLGSLIHSAVNKIVKLDCFAHVDHGPGRAGLTLDEIWFDRT